MRSPLLALLPLLVVAAPARAVDGVVRVSGDVVTLETERGAVRLVAGDDERGKLLGQFGALAGLRADVDGRLAKGGLAVTEVHSPRAAELEGLVVERDGALSFVWGEKRCAIVGPRAALLRPLLNREVELRAFVYLRPGEVEVAPVAVRALEGGREGAAATITGRLDWKEVPTLTDAAGRVVTVIGVGRKDVPRGVGAFEGREVVVDGALFGDQLVLGRFVSPSPARLTGRVDGDALVAADGRRLALLADPDMGFSALFAAQDGQEVTVKGLASREAFFVSGVAARPRGEVRPSAGFELPADGQVWIAKHFADGQQIVVADGAKGHALVDGSTLVRPSPTAGLSGALGP